MNVKTRAKRSEAKKEKSDFSRWIANYRELNGYSQRELADKMKISNSEVALTETDRNSFPLGFYKKLYPFLNHSDKEAVKNMFKLGIIRALEGKDE